MFKIFGQTNEVIWKICFQQLEFCGLITDGVLGIFLFTTAVSRTALGPTQPPIQWVPEALSLGVKRPGRAADHVPPSSAEVKEWAELYLHSPNTPPWRGAQLKSRDNFTFTLYKENPVASSYLV
jgi:hypothetical protein